MATISKQSMEKTAKEVSVLKAIEALKDAGFEVSRINDYGSIAFPLDEKIDGVDRYMTVKFILAKPYDEEKDSGFDIFTAEKEYELRVEADEDKRVAKEEKLKANIAKRDKRLAEAKAKKEREASEEE